MIIGLICSDVCSSSQGNDGPHGLSGPKGIRVSLLLSFSCLGSFPCWFMGGEIVRRSQRWRISGFNTTPDQQMSTLSQTESVKSCKLNLLFDIFWLIIMIIFLLTGASWIAWISRNARTSGEFSQHPKSSWNNSLFLSRHFNKNPR